MAKTEKPKINPGPALQMLSDFNQQVLMLVQTVDLALKNDLIDHNVKEMVQRDVDAVKKFYAGYED